MKYLCFEFRWIERRICIDHLKRPNRKMTARWNSDTILMHRISEKGNVIAKRTNEKPKQKHEAQFGKHPSAVNWRQAINLVKFYYYELSLGWVLKWRIFNFEYYCCQFQALLTYTSFHCLLLFKLHNQLFILSFLIHCVDDCSEFICIKL